VKEFERKQLLERLDRDSATLGASIPDTIERDGQEFPLREFVFEIKRQDGIDPADRDRVDSAKTSLRRERKHRRDRIEAGEISVEEGQREVETIIGLSRALEALEQLEPVDIEQEQQAREVADRKRWISFLQQALGHEDDGSAGARTHDR
jgi:hypothetical protein